MHKLGILKLPEEARNIRREIIKMLLKSGAGHSGSSLSSADIMAALFFNVMNHHPDAPKWPDRDRFVLSKGHAAPVLYATLARAGFIPTEELDTLVRPGSRLQGHPGVVELPVIECSTGSLGHGLPISIGFALAARLDKKDYRVYCLMGDGGQEEGSVWEAAMCAAHYKLDNLCAIIDLNGLQISGTTKEVMDSSSLKKKYQAFGWNVVSVSGHSAWQLVLAFKLARMKKGRPTIILAKTIKGKGVSFMENKVEWHGRAPNAEEAAKALAELNKKSP